MLRFTENIVALRQARLLNQEQLAETFNVTNQEISDWESGQSYPNLELLPTIAKYFGISIDDLLLSTPEHLKSFCAKPDDQLMKAAIELAKKHLALDAALLQRELQIGFTKANNIIREMINCNYLCKSPFEPNSYFYTSPPLDL